MSDEQKSENEKAFRRRQLMEALGVAGLGAFAGCAGGGSDGGDGEDSDGGGGSGGGTTSGGSTTTETTSSGSGSDINTGGELKVGVQADVTKLDPQKSSAYSSFQVLDNVYERLIKIDLELKPTGQLAKDWSTNDEGTEWTFELHQGVQWHPPVSRELKASDVVYSINRILDPDTGSPRKSDFDPITNVEATGDYTVVFEFDEPYAPFLYKLRSGYILPEGADDASEYDIATEPVGTGPFTFEEHVSQSHTLITAYDDYWQEDDNGNQLPYLDAVRFKPVPEGSSRVTNVRSGELHLVGDPPRSQAQGLKNDDGVTFSAKPGTWFDYLGHNQESPPLDDVKLRQAISWAVNREKIAQGARFGFARPTQNPVPHASVWKDHIQVDEPFQQNKEKAKQLLEESKYDGEEIGIMVGQQYKGQVREAEIVQEQLSGIGINAVVDQTEWGTMVNRMSERDFDITLVGWLGFVDPDSMFYQLFHTGEKWNWVSYENEQVDKWLEQGRRAVGPIEERAKFYDKADDKIAHEAAYTFLHFNDDIFAWQNSVKNFPHMSTGATRFKRVWLDE